MSSLTSGSGRAKPTSSSIWYSLKMVHDFSTGDDLSAAILAVCSVPPQARVVSEHLFITEVATTHHIGSRKRLPLLE